MYLALNPSIVASPVHTRSIHTVCYNLELAIYGKFSESTFVQYTLKRFRFSFSSWTIVSLHQEAKRYRETRKEVFYCDFAASNSHFITECRCLLHLTEFSVRFHFELATHVPTNKWFCMSTRQTSRPAVQVIQPFRIIHVTLSNLSEIDLKLGTKSKLIQLKNTQRTRYHVGSCKYWRVCVNWHRKPEVFEFKIL